MSEGDVFREVEEDLRREKLARAWDSYGLYIIGIAVLAVVLVGGNAVWRWQQDKRAAQSGDAFVAATVAAEAGKGDEAKTALAKLQKEGGAGYRLLALLRQAGLAAEAGNVDDAVKLYDEAASLKDPNAMLTGLARIQAASLRLDSAPESEIISRVGALAGGAADAWRNSARELLAFAALKAERRDEAEKQFSAVFADPQTPAAMRTRAEQMLGMLVQRAPAQPAVIPAPAPVAAEPAKTN